MATASQAENDPLGEATEELLLRPARAAVPIERLGRYRLERLLGAGGMAEVYLARADGPGGFEKQVVVKRIRPALVRNRKFVEMFLREARLLASLVHVNIVQIFELAQQDDEYFLALEYLEGLSLRDIADRYWNASKPLPIEIVLRIIADAALGLDYAHNVPDRSGEPAHLVHRDVSPDNLFVTTTGITKVLDFGIAKREGRDVLTEVGELKGKVPYMSPEQVRGDPLDGRSDIFSLGVVLYYLLGGRRPFDTSSDLFTMRAILEAEPKRLVTLNPSVPEKLDALVMRVLAKNRDERVQSGAALHDALVGLLQGTPWPSMSSAQLVSHAMQLEGTNYEVTPTCAAKPLVPWPSTSPVTPVATSSAVALLEAIPAPVEERAAPITDAEARAPQTTPSLEGFVPKPLKRQQPVAVDEVVVANAAETARSVRRLQMLPIAVGAIAALGVVAILLTIVGVPQTVYDRAHDPNVKEARAGSSPKPEVGTVPAPTVATAPPVVAADPAARPTTFDDESGAARGPEPTARDDDGRAARNAAKRTVLARAPARIQWQSRSGKVLGAGNASLAIEPTAPFLFAFDVQRGVKTRVPVTGGRVDYGDLPHQELSVRVRPFADVFLGNERIGTTPLEKPIDVVPGTYQVRLVYQDRERIIAVDVKPGVRAAVQVDMRAP